MEGARRLRLAGSASGRLEAELLLGLVLGAPRVEVLAHPERGVPGEAEARFWDLVARREASEPIAYLLGEREFYGRMFHTDARALIPRPETELLVELGVGAVARWRANGVEPRVVDVGTGCGAIGVSVAAECGVQVIGTDVSFAALPLARENAALYTVNFRVVQADLLRGLKGPLHVVLANLPYVPSSRRLPVDVRHYEPHVAIFGGQRGTELIERLLHEARELLAPGGELAVELDEDEQATPIATLARHLYPSAEVSVCHDAGGYDRVVRLVSAKP
ncbi:MAG: peptide chain release factor N(5)-glutamine methyltransferase [Chloroflexi bacterium]|nr:peptide chain release factor N(5)-glutamine methyltransferase [Chloroflexota bacterium]MBV9596516.1 peptide chain release factor N(5)-glutamine methyltransferase [Chloroflexota bacterium]